jgi:hypothetical protein
MSNVAEYSNRDAVMWTINKENEDDSWVAKLEVELAFVSWHSSKSSFEISLRSTPASPQITFRDWDFSVAHAM